MIVQLTWPCSWSATMTTSQTAAAIIVSLRRRRKRGLVCRVPCLLESLRCATRWPTKVGKLLLEGHEYVESLRSATNWPTKEACFGEMAGNIFSAITLRLTIL